MTARKHADYVYRDSRDSLRVRVHRRDNGRWDYDVFYLSGAITTYSAEAGDDFPTKAAALAGANEQLGRLYPIAVEGNVVDAAWYQKAAKASRSPRSNGSLKKRSAQLDSQIAHARASARPEGLDDGGVFYLTDAREYPLGPEFRSRASAKRAAMKLVRDRAHPRVEVWHDWRGDRYMQGLASEEGWSDV